MWRERRGEFVSIEVEFNLKWKKVHESWLNMHSFPIKFKDNRRIERKTRESRSNRLGTGLELSLSQCRLFRSWILFVILSSIYFYSVSFFSSCWERQKVSLQAEAITVTQLKYGLRFTMFYEWMLNLNVQFTVTSLSENAIPIGFFSRLFPFSTLRESGACCTLRCFMTFGCTNGSVCDAEISLLSPCFLYLMSSDNDSKIPFIK